MIKRYRNGVINKKKYVFIKQIGFCYIKLEDGSWKVGDRYLAAGSSRAINTLIYSKQKIIINIIDDQGRKGKLVLISAYKQEWRLDISRGQGGYL